MNTDVVADVDTKQAQSVDVGCIDAERKGGEGEGEGDEYRQTKGISKR